jgi:C4-dicarboxylate transporter, DctQ subunit
MKRALDALSGSLAAAALMLACLSVGLRYLAPQWIFDWSDEVVIMLLIWAMFLSGYSLTVERSHVVVDLLTHGRPLAVRRRYELAGTFGLMLFAAFMAVAGADMVIQTVALGERTESTARIPTWIYYAALPVGMALTVWGAILVIAGRAGPPGEASVDEIAGGTGPQ